MWPIIKRKKIDSKADPQNIQRLDLAEKDLEDNYHKYLKENRESGVQKRWLKRWRISTENWNLSKKEASGHSRMAICESKDSLDVFNSRSQAGEPEDTWIEKKKKNKHWRADQSVRYAEYKEPNIHEIGIPEGKEVKNEEERLNSLKSKPLQIPVEDVSHLDVHVLVVTLADYVLRRANPIPPPILLSPHL